MFEPEALAVVIAALDGADPNITQQPDGSIVSTPGRGTSDLQLATEDLLHHRMPAVAVHDVARAALAVAMATANTLGAGGFDVNPRAVAAELRFTLQALAMEGQDE
ncbi:hypothetical protein M3D00_17250 [Dietzia cinnamea]|uniref:hypothetical protein n=1 Tax=Dietzia cinnamea TaxID=321318 RepID=UPI0021A30163|nr:hypothetical protein [Dietzia cinnamea]MCT2031877.1 hypothetical protein [Dietzia cinnamea]